MMGGAVQDECTRSYVDAALRDSAMLGQGKGDVIISSIAGKEVITGGGPYSATKYGVNAIAAALLLETIDQGIRVTTIQPGAVATEFSQMAGYSEDEIRAFASKVLPLHPDNVAVAALYALEQPEHVYIPELTIFYESYLQPYPLKEMRQLKQNFPEMAC